MKIRKITMDEFIEARKICAICFEYPYDAEKEQNKDYIERITKEPKSKDERYFMEKWAAFTDNNEMMSSLTAFPYTMYFDGCKLNTSGIGGVSTHPHHRRKGAVRECFNMALPDMYKNKIDLSYLYPFSEQFYGNFGYQRSASSICWELGLSTLPDYRFPGTFHLYESEKDMDGFKEAYENYAAKFNTMVSRDEYDWDKLKNAKAYINNNYAYLYRDGSGVPKGYMIFKKEIRDGHALLDCCEVIFQDFETLKALMSFARSYGTDYRSIRFYAPDCIPLDYFCTDFSQSFTKKTLGSNGMIRVVNVMNVLKQAHYIGSGCLTLKITDGQIEDNNQFFTVLYENGTAKEVISAEKIQDPIDIECTINFFSGAIMGYYAPEDLNYMDGFTLYCDLDKLKGIFYKKPCWINNYF